MRGLVARIQQNRRLAAGLSVATVLLAVALLPGTLRVARGQSTLPNPPPQTCITVNTPLGTVTICGINLDPGVSPTGVIASSTATSVTITIGATNSAASAGRIVQVCLTSTNCQVITLNGSGSGSATFGTPSGGGIPPPAAQPSASVQTSLGTVTVNGINLDTTVTLDLSIVSAGGLVYEQTGSTVTVLIGTSNGSSSAGRQVQACLNGASCQTLTLNSSGTATATFTSSSAGALASPSPAVTASGGAGVPPPPPPPPVASRTAAPPSTGGPLPPAPSPAGRSTVTPTSVVPARAPSTGLGGAQQQQPVAAAQTRAGASAPQPAGVALPNTGTGNRAKTAGADAAFVALVALALLGAGLLGLRQRRA